MPKKIQIVKQTLGKRNATALTPEEMSYVETRIQEIAAVLDSHHIDHVLLSNGGSVDQKGKFAKAD